MHISRRTRINNGRATTNHRWFCAIHVTTPALIQNSSVQEEVMRIIWVSRPFSTYQEAIVVCQILDDVLLAFYDLFTPFPDAGVEIYYLDPADYTNTVQIL